MKVVLISCFGYYEQRVRFVKEALERNGNQVHIIFSDFDHINKSKVKKKLDGITYIEASPYEKNISIARLYSHYKFSKAIYHKMCEEQPDAIYAIIPPNFLSRYLKKYKLKSNCKLVFDIYDLWPESFVNKKIETLAFPIFRYWGNLRNKSIGYADYIITECNLYQEVLRDFIDPIKVQTLYLTKQRECESKVLRKDIGTLHVCYLGSINNIINIPLIKSCLKAINQVKPVTLDIVGKGESKEYFIEEIRSIGVNVVDHGPLYGEAKRFILEQCHFGINMMVDTVKVGLTMKSIDYFESNLPLLNNIKGDTWNMVESEVVGFNVSEDSADEIAKRIIQLNEDSHLSMSQRANCMFEQYFSEDAFYYNFNKIMKQINWKNCEER